MRALILLNSLTKRVVESNSLSPVPPVSARVQCIDLLTKYWIIYEVLKAIVTMVWWPIIAGSLHNYSTKEFSIVFGEKLRNWCESYPMNWIESLALLSKVNIECRALGVWVEEPPLASDLRLMYLLLFDPQMALRRQRVSGVRLHGIPGWLCTHRHSYTLGFGQI